MSTQPQFPQAMKIAFGALLTANTAKDGTGTIVTIATGGANGTRLDQIKVRAKGTNVATVLRFFINNGADPTVATNNTLVHEVTIAATTLSEVAALADNDITITKNTTETACPIPYLPFGYKLNCTIGTTIAAGIQVTTWGGDL